MLRTSTASILLLLLAGCTAKVPPATLSAVTALTGDPAAGEPIYKHHCLECHGVEGTKEKKAQLPSIVPKHMTDNDLQNDILAGPWIMPNFQKKLTHQQVADVVAYLRRTWGTPPAQ